MIFLQNLPFNAYFMYCTVISLVTSRMAVMGARASNMKVWSLASLLSALCADCQVIFSILTPTLGTWLHPLQET